MFETVLNNPNSHFDESYCLPINTFPKSIDLMQGTSPLFNKPLPTLQLS